MKQIKPGRMLHNNLYMLKEIHKASPSYMLLLLFDSLFGALFDYIVQVFLLATVIGALEGSADFVQVLFLIGILALYPIFFRLYSSHIRMVVTPVAQNKIRQWLQEQIFRKIKSLSLASREDPEFYDSCLKATEEAAGRANEVLQSANWLIANIFTILLVSFTVLFLDPVLAAAAIIPLAADLLLGKRLNKLRKRYRTELQSFSRRRDYVKRVFFLSDYAKDLRMTNISELLFRQFDQAIGNMKKVVRQYGWKLAALDFLLALTESLLSYLGIILYAAYKTLVAGTMPYGTCVVAINAVAQAAAALQSMSASMVEFQGHGMFIENLLLFLQDDAHQEFLGGDRTVPQNGTLRLEGITFHYLGRAEPSLNNLSLVLKPGEKVALVGPNGAGKSTLVKLLLRLYSPDEGKILLDGVPAQEYALDAYRQLFAAVMQNFKIFSMSVRDNILLKKDPTETEKAAVDAALQQVDLEEKVGSLPKGTETILTREFSEEGTVLSGGQYQRIAIARALVQSRPIVILDEPSSALDPIAEYKMYQTMMETFRKKTVILISHRLSAASLMDKICYLDKGTILETGTHQELLEKGGAYAAMWKVQSEQYRMEESHAETALE